MRGSLDIVARFRDYAELIKHHCGIENMSIECGGRIKCGQLVGVANVWQFEDFVRKMGNKDFVQNRLPDRTLL